MIGPAEIDEMMAEYLETIRWTGAGESPQPNWPVLVRDDHLDPADSQLIGSHAAWLTSIFGKA